MEILRPSYIHNGISYTCKMTSLYWIGAQVPIDSTHIVGDYFSESDGATLQIPNCQWSSNEQWKNVSKWRTYSVCHRTTTKNILGNTEIVWVWLWVYGVYCMTGRCLPIQELSQSVALNFLQTPVFLLFRNTDLVRAHKYFCRRRQSHVHFL